MEDDFTFLIIPPFEKMMWQFVSSIMDSVQQQQIAMVQSEIQRDRAERQYQEQKVIYLAHRGGKDEKWN